MIARLARHGGQARQRGHEAAEFNRRIRVARAFTCFQLTELLVRVPRMLEKIAADALVVTALPDLYFDEDVRDRDACVTFHHALDALRALRPLPLGVAVFSDATSFETSRRSMFTQLTAQATELWRFALDGEGGKLVPDWGEELQSGSSRPGDFPARAAKFPASKEAGYSNRKFSSVFSVPSVVKVFSSAGKSI